MDTEEALQVKRKFKIVWNEILEKYRVGDVGLLEHESTKIFNVWNVITGLFLVSFVVLSMGVLSFTYFTFDDLITSSMLIICFITVVLEFIFFRILIIFILSLIMHFINRWKLRAAMVDIRQVNTKSKKPRNYITADIDDGPKKKKFKINQRRIRNLN